MPKWLKYSIHNLIYQYIQPNREINLRMCKKSWVIVIIGLLILSFHTSCNHYQSLPGGWENEYLGKTEGLLFYPDNYANYWAFTLNPQKLKNIGFKITGRLPNARYMSLNLYLHKTKQSVGSVIDVEIEKKGKEYEVWVLPKNGEIQKPNALYFTENEGKHSIFLRYYGSNGDDYGDVPLPKIQAVNLETGEDIFLPHVKFNLLSSKVLPKIITFFIGRYNRGKPYRNQEKGKVYSYRHSGRGFFPNNDNRYLFMPLLKAKDEALIIRVKPPNYAKTRNDTSAQVRYWSIALGTPETTNHNTLMDKEAKIHDDGFVYLVIGAEKKASHHPNWNYLPWTFKRKKAVLIYRHLLTHPNFEYAMWNAEAFKLHDEKRVAASEYLGDYAPVGRVVSEEDLDKKLEQIFWGN